MKRGLEAEGFGEVYAQSVQLKMLSQDGKQRVTDAADTRTLLRIIQSIKSPKAEPFKRWLAEIGAQRIEEIENSELAMERSLVDNYRWSKKMDLPFTLETELEARICADAEWKKGAVWGKPRPGHSEGVVMYHIAEVLANVDRLATTPEERRVLRLIALIHDTFKYRVDPGQPKTGPNHHAVIARKFAERYLDNQALLEIIELHDEAFNSWRLGAVKGRWKEAEERASRLVARLGSSLPLYVCFYRADNATGSKENDSLIWFEQFLHRRGIDVPPEVK